MTSIRTRILAPTIVLVIVGSLLLAWLTLRDSQHRLESVYDAQLVQGARLLHGLVLLRKQEQIDWYSFASTLDTALNHSGQGFSDQPYRVHLEFQVWTADGRLMGRSSNAPKLDIPPGAGMQSFIYEAQGWRGVLVKGNDHGMSIWVGERADLRDGVIKEMLKQALLPTVIGLPVLVVIIRLLLGWGLRPLNNFAQQLRSRPRDSLRPLSHEPLPVELEPMRQALDRQMELLRELLERERRFITAAAHELRTPLAILDIHARNAREACCAEERETALGHVQHGLERATRIASQLLTMARIEPRQRISESINFTSLVREELAELAPLALKRNIELSLDASDDIYLSGDSVSLAIMLQNLISNALTFAPDNSEISVRLRRMGAGNVRMEVLDRGPGVSESQLDRLCDPFYSSGNPLGAGLGLSIVEMISRNRGGQVTFTNRFDGGLCVGVELPGESRPTAKPAQRPEEAVAK